MKERRMRPPGLGRAVNTTAHEFSDVPILPQVSRICAKEF